MTGTASGPLKVSLEPDNPGVAMQHYIDARLADYKASHEREHAVERELAREARDTLSAVMAAKFESQNEFRATLTDQAASFMTRDSFDRQHASLTDKFDAQCRSMSQRVDDVEDQATKSAIIVGVVAGLLGLLAGALVVPIIEHFVTGGA